MNKEAKGTVGHQGLRWPTTIWMIVFHLGAVAALFYWSWKGLIVAAVLAWVAQSLGCITPIATNGATIRTLLTMAAGGHTWAGFCGERRSSTVRKFWSVMLP